jgi:hypothetical protein
MTLIGVVQMTNNSETKKYTAAIIFLRQAQACFAGQIIKDNDEFSRDCFAVLDDMMSQAREEETKRKKVTLKVVK